MRFFNEVFSIVLFLFVVSLSVFSVSSYFFGYVVGDHQYCCQQSMYAVADYPSLIGVVEPLVSASMTLAFVSGSILLMLVLLWFWL